MLKKQQRVMSVKNNIFLKKREKSDNLNIFFLDKIWFIVYINTKSCIKYITILLQVHLLVCIITMLNKLHVFS